MKKPSLSDALAQKAPPPTLEPAAADPPTAAAKRDGRVVTTLRISPEDLEALKIIAAKERGRVNDLILEGVAHVLALRNIRT